MHVDSPQSGRPSEEENDERRMAQLRQVLVWFVERREQVAAAGYIAARDGLECVHVVLVLVLRRDQLDRFAEQDARHGIERVVVVAWS